MTVPDWERTNAVEPTDHDDLRAGVIVAFLSVGVIPTPSRAAMVAMLAKARQTITALAGDFGAVSAWLEGEVPHFGVRENAAVLAVVERLRGADRDDLLAAYLTRHPERDGAVDSLRAVVLRLG